MAAGATTLQIRINADGSAAITNLKQVQGAVDGVGKKGKEASTGVNELAKSLQGMAITAGAALSVSALARSFITANVESQRLAKGLTAVTGSTTAGAAEMAYLQATADRLGLSLKAAAPAYVNLTAATKGTRLEGQATKDIFEAVSLAMAKLGKSSADTQGALLAIEQMVSKGVVSAEELRGQLGERLPGAFRLAAEAMGVTEQKLGEMLASGEILATDLLPRLVQGLNKLYDDGKQVTGLEADWNLLVNALDRFLVSADKATGITGALSSAMQVAAGIASSFADTLDAISNFNAGIGFRTFQDDLAKYGVTLQASNKALDEYVAARKRADDLKPITAFGIADDAANDADEALAKFQKLRVAAYELRKGLDETDAAAKATKQSLAMTVGDDAIKLYRDHQAAIDANAASMDKLNGQYDKSIAKKAEYQKMEEAVAEAIKLGRMTQEEGQAALENFAAAQDKATESAGRHSKALSAEAQTVAALEQQYGLYKGQLDAIWKLESNRGKGAGVESARWVQDLAAGSGHMTKIVGEFQMAESTAKGLGANMGTFNGQAEAAAKYLAQAAAQGKTLWEQFAYYHGGPNEKAWGEKTRAYADAAVKIVADATGTMQDLGQNTGQVITAALDNANAAVQRMIERYLPAEAAARAYAEAQQALALSSDFASLSQEKQAVILAGLKKDYEASQKTASQTAKVWETMWENAVKRIDDTFASLWENLITGTGNTLSNVKDMLLKWLAEVSYQMLLKPIVVGVTTTLLGGTSTASVAGQVASGSSGTSGIFSNLSSLFSGNSLGSSIAKGLNGIFGAFGDVSHSVQGFLGNLASASNWSLAGGGILGSIAGNLLFGNKGFGSIGSSIGSSLGSIAAAGMAFGPVGVLVGGLLGGLAGGALGSLFGGDKEPRPGAYAAITHNGTGMLEDNVGVKGAFGLTFGMSDIGTKNLDAEEMRATFEGFAKVSEVLAQFYGKDVAAQVEASLKKASEEGWSKNGIMRLAMDANEAFDLMFTQVIDHAAATGDALAIVMKAIVGDLTGTAEDMANQIEISMQSAALAVGFAEALKGQDMEKTLELDGSLVENALKIVDYANAMKQSGETTGEAIARLVLNLGVFDQSLTLTGNNIDATGMAFVDLANALADAADEAKIGMDGLAQLQAAYYAHFFTEEERAIKTRDEMLKAIAKWNTENGRMGDTAITTSAQFRKYIESLDLQTAEGRKAYVEAMKMVGVFITLDEALKLLGDTLDKLPSDIEVLRKALKDLMIALDPTQDIDAQKAKDDAKNALLNAGYRGDFTAQSIAEFLRQLLALDDSALEAYKALMKMQEGILALAKIAEQRAQMEVRLLELTQGREAALAAQRARELAALDPSLRELQKRIWLLEDEANALNELNGVLDRIYGALGEDDLARELQRRLELAAADERNRPFLELLYQIEDEQRARQKMLEAEKNALEAAHVARMESLAQEREATQELLTAAQGLLSSIKSALSNLRNQLPLDEINLARSRRALAEWASAKRLPDQVALDRAITGISGDSADNYVTASAYRLAKQGDLANLLTLEQLAQTQVSDAERLLKSLDDLQSSLTKQHEAAMAALDAKYALDEDWKKRQLDLLNALLKKLYPDQAPADSKPIGEPLPPAPQDSQERQDKNFDALLAEIALLRRDMATLSAAQIQPLKSLDDRVKKWDLDGLPSERDAGDVALLRAA